MIKNLAVVLFAISLSAGAAQAMTMHHHMHMAKCADGMVKASCICAAAASKAHQVCKAGQWCHTFMGTCGK